MFKLRFLFVLCFLKTVVGSNDDNYTCAYSVQEDGRSIQNFRPPFILSDITQCLEYNGQQGCCDINNDISLVASYQAIDGVFGSKGGGCDICAINLKRFWCEYACSPRQSAFMNTSKEMQWKPDPQKPGEMILVQIINLTVEAETACYLYDSCSRVPFVASVSAMGSPAGFLHFQGMNAVDNAFQFINVKFSNSFQDSLSLSNKSINSSGKALQRCNFKTNQSEIHQFHFDKNCTCNTCKQSCDTTSGFIYTQSGVMEGFDTTLVVIVCSASLTIALLLTFIRYKYRQKQKHN